ncbi:MAG: hypothetical protein F2741_03220 [Actinobacteria bacterium]|nr:hypothetical protein [Actinomycetota bacterium]MTH91145.1 hypothetical protein [Actinomycetota bacterium]
MTDKAILIQRASRSAHLLRRINIVTLCVAVVVYAGLIAIAIYNLLLPLVVFSSCIMLAELLVFQIVRTLSDHLDLFRRATD